MFSPGNRRSTRVGRSSRGSTGRASRGGEASWRAGKNRPAKKWVQVKRPPSATSSFRIPTWVPLEDLTHEERTQLFPNEMNVQEKVDSKAPPLVALPAPAGSTPEVPVVPPSTATVPKETVVASTTMAPTTVLASAPVVSEPFPAVSSLQGPVETEKVATTESVVLPPPTNVAGNSESMPPPAPVAQVPAAAASSSPTEEEAERQAKRQRLEPTLESALPPASVSAADAPALTSSTQSGATGPEDVSSIKPAEMETSKATDESTPPVSASTAPVIPPPAANVGGNNSQPTRMPPVPVANEQAPAISNSTGDEEEEADREAKRPRLV